MQAVQHVRGHRSLSMTLTLMAITAALVLSGLIGYLVKGSTTVITRTPSPRHNPGPSCPRADARALSTATRAVDTGRARRRAHRPGPSTATR
jgi:hypothetical protein